MCGKEHVTYQEEGLCLGCDVLVPMKGSSVQRNCEPTYLCVVDVRFSVVFSA